MMKSLLIIANPSKTSFTHAMADAYKEKCRIAWWEVQIIDLYDLNQNFLAYESTTELQKWNHNGGDKMIEVQKQITWCDEMVFFFPIWWWWAPAILKNFFDVNFSAGFAFQFVSGSSMPKKLLTNKTAKIFTTCDAPAFLYQCSFILGINLKKSFWKSILWFCGISLREYKIFWNLRKQTAQQKQNILNKIKT